MAETSAALNFKFKHIVFSMREIHGAKYFQAICIYILFAFQNHVLAQTYTLPNEICVFSFETKGGKKMTLSKDKVDKYIVYRFGTKNKIEFEYPQDKKNSFKNFKYSFYLRGGGTQNEGLDLNYINFTNNNTQYVIYETYYAVGNKNSCGIKVIDLSTKIIINIPALLKSKKGTLVDFRDNKLLEITEEMFE